MFPTIACAGPFCLQTLNIFLIAAFLTAGFIFFKKIREEHYLEMEAFDGFFLSLLTGLLGGRIAYLVINHGQFADAPNRWLDIITYPGINGVVAVGVALWFLYRWSKSVAADRFELLDIWCQAVTAALSIIWLGLFFDGASQGLSTSLPVGLTFPGQIEPRLPVQLLAALFFLCLHVYLRWVEYRYRTYNWYRTSKKSAQSGYLTAVTILAASLFWVALSFLRQNQFIIGGTNLDVWIGLTGVICGLFLLFNRSGRLQFGKGK